MEKTIIALPPVITALTLTGCWTPPNANVQWIGPGFSHYWDNNFTGWSVGGNVAFRF